MKDVNLTGIFLSLASRFGCSNFNCSSIIPIDGEPIDMLLVFNINDFNEEDIDIVNEIIYENITCEVKGVDTKFDNKGLSIYVEFTNSKFID